MSAMKVRWSGVESVCREVAAVAGRGLACWVEDADGNVLVGTRDDSDSPARHPVHVAGRECGTACVVGRDAERWAQFAASTLSRELEAAVAGAGEERGRQGAQWPGHSVSPV